MKGITKTVEQVNKKVEAVSQFRGEGSVLTVKARTGEVVHLAHKGSSRTWCGCIAAHKVMIPTTGTVQMCERC